MAGSANWNTPAAWSPAGDPATGDAVNLFNGATAFPVITFDGTGAPAGALSSIIVDGTNAGFVTLSQTAGTLSSPSEYVGVTGNALLSITGGSHSATNVMNVAYDPNSRGTVNQSAGLVSVGLLVLGDDTNTNATYIQSGGVANIAGIQAGASRTSASGTYTLSGPSTTLNLTGNAQVGVVGTGTINQSAGVINATNGNFQLGANAGATGTFNLSGGTYNQQSQSFAVGAVGTGVMNQTGGAANVNFLFIAGFGSTSSATVGTYNLSGAASTLNATSVESVGYYGTGTFNQSDGVNTTTQGLLIAPNLGSVGNYNLSGGTINCAATDLIIGGTIGGVGTFSQSAGTATFFDAAIGYSTSPAVVNLTGGAFKTLGAVIVGNYGNGAFNQTGGTVTASSLTLSNMPLSAGTFTLGGGVLNVGTESVGETSGAAFVQTGGAHNVTGVLTVGDGGTATFALGGGNLTAANELIGHLATGTFTQSGGTHTVTGTLSVATNGGGAAGTYSLLNGSLFANAIVVNPNGLFNQSGGTLLANNFTLAGGTVTGTLQNLGTFNYQNGTFTGRLINEGTVNLAASFTAGNGIENDATLSIPTALTVFANGAGFDNLGTFNLGLGTLAGTGPLLNDYGGVMHAAGVVSGAFTNDGELDVTGLLTVTNPANNFGVINLPASDNLRHAGLTNSGSINLTGGSLSGAAGVTNNPAGTIAGGGSIAALANNGGLVYANGASPLVVSNLAANINGGELRVANNSTLTVANAFINGGVITLQGTGASFNGGAIANAGTITGVGRLSNALTNTGVVRATGGQLTLSAANITNNATGQIQVTTGNTVSFPQGLSNAGTISLGGGVVDTGSAVLTNTGQLLGNGTVTTGGLLNSGTASFADIASSVYGPVTNTGSLKITSNTTTFYGPVTNKGNVKTTAAVARFLAPFTNNGVYVSDPSAQYFTDLTLGPAGALVGGAGDVFTLTGSLRSTSTRADAWSTRAAALVFAAGDAPTHDLDVSGDDAWGSLELGAGQSLLLHDADAVPGGALYASILQLDAARSAGALPAYIATHLLNADAADPIDVYYDPAAPANAYLADHTYPLGNGGVLAPAVATPEPTSLAIWAVAGCLAGVSGRRRSAARKPFAFSEATG